MSKIKLGKYKHYKGHMSEVIGVAKHSEDLREEFVVYKHPDENGEDQLWIRPIKMFEENVETENYKGPRFEYLGE
jgi:hypothetical protein